MHKIYEDISREYLSEKFKETRKQLGLTQEQMAEKLDIAPRSYIEIEHGKSLCKVQTLFHFLSFFHSSEELIKEITELFAEATKTVI